MNDARTAAIIRLAQREADKEDDATILSMYKELQVAAIERIRELEAEIARLRQEDFDLLTERTERCVALEARLAEAEQIIGSALSWLGEKPNPKEAERNLRMYAYWRSSDPAGRTKKPDADTEGDAP